MADNYASWRAQFTNLLFGYDLLGCLNGTTLCPPETILQSGSTTPISNPECKLWKRHNDYILHAILALVTWAVASLISSTTTSHEAWQKLEITFANQSRTKMLSLHNILMKTTKGSQSIVEYTQTIKIITDDLALMGYPLSEDEIILHDQETLLKQDDTSKETPSITAQFHHKFTNHKGSSEKSGGHSGAGHSAKVCRSRPPPRFSPQANYMARDQANDSTTWIVDSSASHHITSDLQNLSLHSNYGGYENIMIDDGIKEMSTSGQRHPQPPQPNHMSFSPTNPP
ncbi:Retrovirus-related Pol polyprotein from transposon RE1 [Vitis vinifera]|uniref:Retrovirus-related Pol polyprotein from transposon RE1 n=1 Tax=Vitis vinifera TaxID=29760 RepID=A0A438C0R1_VITVI|nr:Retrovirus-related Pol polyprotein from transposon RE1 [Vitis vinifera]